MKFCQVSSGFHIISGLRPCSFSTITAPHREWQDPASMSRQEGLLQEIPANLISISTIKLAGRVVNGTAGSTDHGAYTGRECLFCFLLRINYDSSAPEVISISVAKPPGIAVHTFTIVGISRELQNGSRAYNLNDGSSSRWN
jgi:hypothetical protein